MTKPYNVNDLKGIGGWLVLVALGVTLSPFSMLGSFLEYSSLILAEDFFRASFTIRTLVWSEAIFFATMIFVTTYVAFLFFSKRREFPNWYVGTYIILIAYTIANMAFVTLFLSEVDTGSSSGAVFGQMIVATIWVLYVLKSKRVRLTFVED